MAGRWIWGVAFVTAAAAAGAFVALHRTPDAPPARPPDSGSADTPPSDGAAAAPSADAIATKAARTLVVRALESDGERPIAGAAVTLQVPGDEVPGATTTGTTDAQGRAEIALPAEHPPFTVIVRAAAHMRSELEVEEGDLPAVLAVRLEPAATVRGVVRDGDGKAVEGASVFVEAADGNGDYDQLDVDDATTRADGGYEVDGIPPGKLLRVIARADRDPEHASIAVKEGLELGATPQVLTADLTLQVSADLVVRVLWPDALPVRGAHVEVRPAFAYEADTDQSGSATLREMLPGHKTVTVSCWGFADTTTEADVGPGERRALVVRPVPGPSVSGVVVDEAGRPVAEASVQVSASPAKPFVTGPDGTFRIAFPSAMARAIDVTAPGCGTVQVADVTPPAEGLRVVLRSNQVRCRVVWPAGVRHSIRVSAWADGRVTEATLEGDVVSITVPPGTKRVSLRTKGFVGVTRDVTDDTVATADLGEIVLVPAPRLEGRVVDADGRPVDAFVYAKVRDTTVPLESTGNDGSFSIDGLPPGDAEVRVEAKGFVTRTTHHALAAGCRQLVVLLSRGGGVKGVVLSADGKPAPDVVYVSFVDVNDPKNSERMASPNVEDDGRFEVHLAPGHYRAHTEDDGREASAEIDVVDGETHELTLKLAAPR